MSSKAVTRRAAFCGVLALAGCGFAPAFGPDGKAADWRNAVVVEAPNTVFGFRMQARLRENFGAPTAAEFALKVTPKSAPVAATVTEAGDITRINLTGNAEWTLSRLENGAEVQRGLVQTFTSYSATGSTVATQTAEGAARDRLAAALADLIVQQMLTAP